MRGIGGINPDWAVALVRVMLGLVFAMHGFQKFAGGLGGVSTFFEKVAIPLPGVAAPFIAVLELIGGILLILGVGTRVVAALFTVEMLVAALWVVMPSRGWNGSELERMLLVATVLLILGGPGAAALDNFWCERQEAGQGAPRRT